MLLGSSVLSSEYLVPLSSQVLSLSIVLVLGRQGRIDHYKVVLQTLLHVDCNQYHYGMNDSSCLMKHNPLIYVAEMSTSHETRMSQTLGWHAE